MKKGVFSIYVILFIVLSFSVISLGGDLDSACLIGAPVPINKLAGGSITYSKDVTAITDHAVNMSNILVTYNNIIIFNSSVDKQINATDDLTNFLITTSSFNIIGGKNYITTNITYQNETAPTDLHYACELNLVSVADDNITQLIITILTTITALVLIMLWIASYKYIGATPTIIATQIIVTIIILAVLRTGLSLLFT